MINIMLYILGAIAVIAAGFFFMRRDPQPKTAADIGRSQSQEPNKSLNKNSKPKKTQPQNQNNQPRMKIKQTLLKRVSTLKIMINRLNNQDDKNLTIFDLEIN